MAISSPRKAMMPLSVVLAALLFVCLPSLGAAGGSWGRINIKYHIPLPQPPRMLAIGGSAGVLWSKYAQTSEIFYSYRLVAGAQCDEETTKRIYINWVNEELNNRCEVAHSIQDFRSGKHLYYLVNNLYSYAATSNPVIYSSPEKNFYRVIAILTKTNPNLKFNMKSLITGNTHAILDILSIIRDHQISRSSDSLLTNMALSKPASPEAALLTWCQKSIRSYDLSVKNFRGDWQDGLKFSALLSKWTKFNYAEATRMNVKQRLHAITYFISNTLKIKPIFNINEFLNHQVDEKFIILYVAKIYKQLDLKATDLEQVGLCDTQLIKFRDEFKIKIADYQNWYDKVNDIFLAQRKIRCIWDVIRGQVALSNVIEEFKSRKEIIENTLNAYNTYLYKYNRGNTGEMCALRKRLVDDFNGFMIILSRNIEQSIKNNRNSFKHTIDEVSKQIYVITKSLRITETWCSLKPDQVLGRIQNLEVQIEAMKFVEIHTAIDFFIVKFNGFIPTSDVIYWKHKLSTIEKQYKSMIDILKNLNSWVQEGLRKLNQNDKIGMTFVSDVTYLLAKNPNPSDEVAITIVKDNMLALLDESHPKYSANVTLKVKEALVLLKERIPVLERMVVRINKFSVEMSNVFAIQMQEIFNNLEDYNILDKIPQVENNFAALKEDYEILTSICTDAGHTVIEEIQTSWNAIVERWEYIRLHSYSKTHIYVQWINSNCGGAVKPVMKLEDLKNGKHLFIFIRTLFSIDAPTCLYNTPEQYFTAIIDILVQRKITVNVDITDLVAGNKEVLQNLLISIRDYYVSIKIQTLTDILVMSPEVDMGSPEDILLTWCQKSTGLIINDFTSKSWSSGLEFGAILRKYVSTFKYDSLLTMTVQDRFKVIFRIFETELKVPSLFRIEDFAHEDTIDERLIILYITHIFNAVPHTPQSLANLGFDVDHKLSVFRARFETQRATYKKWFLDINIQVTAVVTPSCIGDIFKGYERFQMWIAELKKYEKHLSEQHTEYTHYYTDELKVFVNTEISNLWNTWNTEFEEFQAQFLAYYNNFKFTSYKLIMAQVDKNQASTQKIEAAITALTESITNVNNTSVTVEIIKVIKQKWEETYAIIGTTESTIRDAIALINQFTERFSDDYQTADIKKLNYIYTLLEQMTSFKNKNKQFADMIGDLEIRKQADDILVSVQEILVIVQDLIVKRPNPSIRNEVNLAIHILKSHVVSVERLLTKTHRLFYDKVMTVVEEVKATVEGPLKELEQQFRDVSLFESHNYKMGTNITGKVIEMIYAKQDISMELDNLEAEHLKNVELYSVVKAWCVKYGFTVDQGPEARYQNAVKRYQWIMDRALDITSTGVTLFGIPQMPQINNASELMDGTRILINICTIFGVTDVVISEVPETNFQAIINILIEHGVVVDFTATDCMTGRISTIIKLVKIIQTQTIKFTVTFPSDLTDPDVTENTNATDLLIMWVRKSVINTGISVNNFGSSSWSDGYAFSAILARWYSEFSYEFVITKTIEERLTYVFEFIQNKLEIPQLLTKEDLLNCKYDETTVIFYVTMIFRTIRVSHPNTWTELGFGCDDIKLQEIRDRIINETRLNDEWYAATIAMIPDVATFNSLEQISKIGKEFDVLLMQIKERETLIENLRIEIIEYFKESEKPMKPEIENLIEIYVKNFEIFKMKCTAKFTSYLEYSFSFIDAVSHQENTGISSIKDELNAIDISMVTFETDFEKLVAIKKRIETITIEITVTQINAFLAIYRSNYESVKIDSLEIQLKLTLELYTEIKILIEQKLSTVSLFRQQIDSVNVFIKEVNVLLATSVNPSDAEALLARITVLKEKEAEAVKMTSEVSGEVLVKIQEILVNIRTVIASTEEMHIEISKFIETIKTFVVTNTVLKDALDADKDIKFDFTAQELIYTEIIAIYEKIEARCTTLSFNVIEIVKAEFTSMKAMWESILKLKAAPSFGPTNKNVDLLTIQVFGVPTPKVSVQKVIESEVVDTTEVICTPLKTGHCQVEFQVDGSSHYKVSATNMWKSISFKFSTNIEITPEN